MKAIFYSFKFAKNNLRLNFSTEIKGAVTFGCNVKIQKNVVLDCCYLGDYSYVAQNSLIYSAKIGRFCSIANDVIIGPPSHDLNLLSTHPQFELSKQTDKIVVIEDSVWIGARVIIMPGVTIGSGSVVGAGSVVTKNVPENMIVAGVPAAPIRVRLKDDDNVNFINLFQLDTEEIIEKIS